MELQTWNFLLLCQSLLFFIYIMQFQENLFKDTVMMPNPWFNIIDNEKV